MTMRVKMSIHVRVENGEERKMELSVRSEQFEEDMRRVMHSFSKVAGKAALSGYEAQLKAGEYREGVRIRTEKRTYRFEGFSIEYRRCSYRMSDGSVFTPLDQVLGFARYQRRSWKAKEQIGAIAASISYRKAAQISAYIRQEKISPATVCRVVHEVGQRIEAQEAVFEAREAGKIKAPQLFCESDGINISLQKAGRKRTEVRVAITYTGKKYISAQRRRLLNKTCITSLGADSKKWQERVRERTCARYDLEQTKALFIGGDGAEWVDHSFDLLGVGQVTRVLDPFHVKKAVRDAFGREKAVRKLIARLYEQGFASVEEALLDRLPDASEAKVKARLGCLQYLRNHANEIITTRPSLGAMESNVGKLIGQRMKTRGVSWSIAGAQAMLAILSHQDQLFDHCFQYHDFQLKPSRKSYLRTKALTGSIHSASFPILSSGKISAPYAKLFKAIINDDLPLSS